MPAGATFFEVYGANGAIVVNQNTSQGLIVANLEKADSSLDWVEV